MGLLKEISKTKISDVATTPRPSDSHPLVATSVGGVAVVASEATASESPPAPRREHPPCSCLRTRRIITVGCDAAGELDWTTAEQHRQCVSCGAIF